MIESNETFKAFQKAWPRSRLQNMTLDDYCSVGNDDAFCYWLEFKTSELGGIGGGSAYKFIVFKRKSPKAEAKDSPYATDGVYAWVKHYGGTAQEAFATVKAGLLAAVEAAAREDLVSLDAVDLPAMMKWKTAFLYQDQSSPCIVPIFYEPAIMYLAFGDPSAKRSFGEAQAALARSMPRGTDIIEFMQREWDRWAAFEGSVEGLIASDSLPWKDEVAERLKVKNEAVIWWSKRPSGRSIVWAQLRKIIAGGGSFFSYFSNGGTVSHRARIVDIAFPSEYETKKSRWAEASGYQESWEDYVDDNKSAAIAFLIDEMARLEPALKTSDFEYWGGYSAPTQDNLQPFVSVRGEQAEESEPRGAMESTLTLPAKNVIFYGPPGTGKTFFLRSELFRRFTRATAGKSRKSWLVDETEAMSWWKVVAAVLLDGGPARVPAIAEHEFIRAKSETTEQASPRAMIWAMLQQHTFDDCENVKYARRADPSLFRKDIGSLWSVDSQAVKDAVPEVEEFVSAAKTYTASGQAIEQNYTFITFHQSMSYEDFIEGIKPRLGEEIADQGLAYELKDGIFKELLRPGAPQSRFRLRHTHRRDQPGKRSQCFRRAHLSHRGRQAGGKSLFPDRETALLARGFQRAG